MELEEGKHYTIEQGCPIDDGGGEDVEDASGGQSRVASDADEPEPVAKPAKSKSKKAAAAPEVAPAPEAVR